jgi:hypothetical protein
MRTLVGFLVVGVLAVANQRHDVHAAQRTTSVPLYGAPIAETCESWTADGLTRTGVHAQAQAAWVFGFVSGSAAAAMLSHNGLVFPDDTGTAEIEMWMSNYCTDHPASPMVVAAMRLVDYLNKGAR